MFSGIVEELGRVDANQDSRITVTAERALEGADSGESIAVNGCCLTIAQLSAGAFTADVMPETARRTTLEALRTGERVNLETSLRFGERVGGHLVTGHVDATGVVTSLMDDSRARRVTIAAPESLMELVAAQGSVAVDGISLTVVDVFAGAFTVSLIPHTLTITTAGGWSIGSRVNLEADLLARYVRRALDDAGRAPAGWQRSLDTAQRLEA